MPSSVELHLVDRRVQVLEVIVELPKVDEKVSPFTLHVNYPSNAERVGLVVKVSSLTTKREVRIATKPKIPDFMLIPEVPQGFKASEVHPDKIIHLITLTKELIKVRQQTEPANH